MTASDALPTEPSGPVPVTAGALGAKARADGVSFLLALVVDLTGKPCAKLVPVACGHGYEICPEVGRLVADLVVDGASSVPETPASDVRSSRFAEGDLLASPHPYVGAGQMR